MFRLRLHTYIRLAIYIDLLVRYLPNKLISIEKQIGYTKKGKIGIGYFSIIIYFCFSSLKISSNL